MSEIENPILKDKTPDAPVVSTGGKKASKVKGKKSKSAKRKKRPRNSLLQVQPKLDSKNWIKEKKP